MLEFLIGYLICGFFGIFLYTWIEYRVYFKGFKSYLRALREGAKFTDTVIIYVFWPVFLASAIGHFINKQVNAKK